MSQSATETHLQRKYPRREFRRGVGVLSAGHYILAESIDIGEGGLSFQSEFMLDAIKTVVITFQIPNGEMISVAGTIRNQRQEGDKVHAGLSFNALTFTYKRQIRYYVSSRAETAGAS